MKKILLTALIVLIYSNVANSQWYDRTCGVTDLITVSSDEFECLWNKASKTARVGYITTIIGSSIVVLGGLQAIIIRTEGAVWNAVFMGMAGGLIDLIGAPIWITGAVRKNNLEKSPHYQDLKMGYLKINPAIGLNEMKNGHYVGVSLSFNF